MIFVPWNWRVSSSENWVALKFPHSEWIRVTPVPSFSMVRRSLESLMLGAVRAVYRGTPLPIKPAGLRSAALLVISTSKGCFLVRHFTSSLTPERGTRAGLPTSVVFVRDFEMRSHRLFSRKWLHSSVRLIHVSLSAGDWIASSI